MVGYKAEELQQEFVRAVHSREEGIMELCSQVIVIGYRFNALDRDSYDRLLRVLSRAAHPQAVLVSPDAETLKDRLSRLYPKIQWVPLAETFEGWVDAGFPGVVST